MTKLLLLLGVGLWSLLALWPRLRKQRAHLAPVTVHTEHRPNRRLPGGEEW